MKARYDSHCPLCEEAIPTGTQYVLLVGKPVHPRCKAQHLVALREGATVEELPEARGWADLPQYMRPGRRRVLRQEPNKDHRHGRNADGRFNPFSD